MTKTPIDILKETVKSYQKYLLLFRQEYYTEGEEKRQQNIAIIKAKIKEFENAINLLLKSKTEYDNIK